MFSVLNKRAYTLIELLIVIAIIGIMAGLAIPMFGTYQQRSVIASDQGNFTQLANYARSLQNNPDYATRTDSTAGYVLRFSNDANGSKVELFSTTDESKIIDQVALAGYFEAQYQNGATDSANGLEIKLSGRNPRENITCTGGTSGCENYVLINFFPEKGSALHKQTEIKNTDDDINQLFSIEESDVPLTRS